MSGLAAVAEALEAAVPGRVTRDAPSAPLTTYRVGGAFAVLVDLPDEGSALAAARVLGVHRPPILVVGRGSNLLVADEGFPGVAVVLGGAFETCAVVAGRSAVRAGGSVPLPVLARRAAAAGVGGLEFYVGIPGSVGGAVRMNAGGHGRETRAVLRRARVLDLLGGEAVDRGADDLGLGYRRSSLRAHDVVLEAELAGSPDDPAACEARIAEIVQWRREHQPGGANAGSVFANPPGDAAGRLIDHTGCKGLRIGGAVVSAKHANFIQAEPGATARDVHELIAEVRRRVAARTGVELSTELRLVGFAADVGADTGGAR